jgi:hypothetical protein
MLIKAAGRAVMPSVSSLAKGVVLMYITYGDLFTFVIMLVAIITLVRDNKRKKIAVLLSAKS